MAASVWLFAPRWRSMKLSEIVSPDVILPELKGKTSAEILLEFSNAISASGKYQNAKVLSDRLYEREQQESTGIGNGLAIPHCKIPDLSQAVLAIGYSPDGVDFKALDGKPTHFFFMVVSPSSASVLHLRVLAALSRLLKSPTFLSRIRQHMDKDEVIALIKEEEEKAAVTP